VVGDLICPDRAGCTNSGGILTCDGTGIRAGGGQSRPQLNETRAETISLRPILQCRAHLPSAYRAGLIALGLQA
jgi:hypothetical protein